MPDDRTRKGERGARSDEIPQILVDGDEVERLRAYERQLKEQEEKAGNLGENARQSATTQLAEGMNRLLADGASTNTRPLAFVDELLQQIPALAPEKRLEAISLCREALSLSNERSQASHQAQLNILQVAEQRIDAAMRLEQKQLAFDKERVEVEREQLKLELERVELEEKRLRLEAQRVEEVEDKRMSIARHKADFEHHLDQRAQEFAQEKSKDNTRLAEQMADGRARRMRMLIREILKAGTQVGGFSVGVYLLLNGQPQVGVALMATAAGWKISDSILKRLGL